MSAYVVFLRERTLDATELDIYARQAPAAREGHDLTPLAFYGDFEVLEGPAIEGGVILRFSECEFSSGSHIVEVIDRSLVGGQGYI